MLFLEIMLKEVIQMAIYYIANIAPNIRQLIQAKSYEQIICNLMNDSCVIFPNRYKQVTEQAHNECDFVDITNNQKFEAKLLFSEQQCYLLAQGSQYFIKWLISICQEIDEVSQEVMKKNFTGIRHTSLFDEMRNRLDKVSNDEAAILFIPFPIVPESQKSIYLQFASDIISITYNAILKDDPEKFTKKGAYIIYPSVIDQKVVLRDLNTYKKEYLPIEYFSPYIEFSLQEIPDQNADYIVYG